MSKETDTTELMALETRFWDAMRDKDGDAAGAMVDPGSIIVGAQGVSSIPDAAMMKKMTESSKWTLKKYSFDAKSTQVRMLTDDIAIVAYKVNETVVVDGETITFDASDSSVWIRRDGSWVCALHTESPAGDPFGRARKG